MKSILQQTLIWLFIYVVYTTVLKLYGLNSRSHILNLAQVPLFMLAYYLLKYVQIPKFYQRGKTSLFLVSLLISAALLFGMYTLFVVFWYNPSK